MIRRISGTAMCMKIIRVKKRVVQKVGRKEVARDRLAEDRQAVQPFGGGDRDILGEPVPDQPVAGDAAGEHQPGDRHAGDPGEPAGAPVAAEREFPEARGPSIIRIMASEA